MRNKRLFTVLISALCTAACLVSLVPSCVMDSYAAVDLLPQSEESDDDKTDETDEYVNPLYAWNASLADREFQCIEVGDADELIELSKECTLDTWSRDKYIKLVADIHLAGTDFTYFPTFGGIFDGNGHTIDGLIMHDDVSYLGLFSKVQPSAYIKNLTLGASILPGNKQMIVGGIAGDNYGIIENCTFEGMVEGNDYTGGIAGYNEKTGIIINCKSYGNITGQHYTGGIAGANCGGIYRSTNNSLINTTNVDKGLSVEDINIGQYIGGLMKLENNDKQEKSLDKANNAIDTGGIAGHSTGVIEFCTNLGDVGYEHVGYNVGGIVGRQSGYVHGCDNGGTVLGRKDVGGIVGQAEPYVQLDLTEDIVHQLTENINELHDAIDVTLTDSGDTSDTITARLNVVKQFVDNALNDTDYLAGESITFINGLTSAGNDVLGRIDYAMDEANKSGGSVDSTKSGMSDVSDAANDLAKAAESANVRAKMSEEDKQRYNRAESDLKAANEKYEGYFDEAKKYNYYYYLYDYSKKTTGDKSYVNMHKEGETGPDGELKPLKADGSTATWPTRAAYIPADTSVFPIVPASVVDDTSIDIDHVVHGDDSEFPATEGDHASIDAALVADARASADDNARQYASYKYPNYTTDVLEYSTEMTVILEPYLKTAEGETSSELRSAANNLKDAGNNLSKATSETASIFKNLNGRDDITLPSLGDGYRLHTDSFIDNMQGMSDNLGFLNEEMNSANGVLVDDMQKVNDQFNQVMLLFTDALDGALDMDYSSVFEDESYDVAETCIQGTVADCNNAGSISGDIDVSGIAGTMAIEYDFDLESDVTGTQDARLNSTYKTKCVIRRGINSGRVTAQKSYAGGATGLQEMGTILFCENYGRIKSNTGDYVGGIAGNSLSKIRDSYSMGIMSGGDYVGGIAGYGHDIFDCYAIPSVTDADSFYGAIAGEVDDGSTLSGNFFVSDNLAGIDRISYSSMAEPVDYRVMMGMENVPKRFGLMQVTFLVDDESVGTRTVSYGGSLSEDQYPDPVDEEDYYIEWDTGRVHDLTSYLEVEGERSLYRTTLAGSRLRANKQSVILVDGKFKIGQEITVTQSLEKEPGLENAIERWDVKIPDDKQLTHVMRLQLPEGVKKAEIYVKDSNGCNTVEADLMGMYYLFDVTGKNVSVFIVDKTTPLRIYILIGAIALCIILVIITVIVINYRKKHPKYKAQIKKRKKERKQKVKEKRRELIENSREKAQQLIEDARDDSPRGEA